MAQEQQVSDSAFQKACSYLNFSKRARWLAHLAAAGTGLMTVGLLCVLYLFADLMDWHGRIPSLRELSPLQARRLEDRWNNTDPRDRVGILLRDNYNEATANSISSKTFGQLPPEDQEAIWEIFVYDTLNRWMGYEVAWAVFREAHTNTSGYELDDADHGILSLVVREEASGWVFSPIRYVARLNGWWMYNGLTGSRGLFPPYLTGLALIAATLGLLWAILLVVNRSMAAQATVEATTRLRRAVYHHTFRLGTLAIRALGPSEAVSILTRHIEAVHDALFAYLTVYYRELITLGLLLVFAFLVAPILSLVFLLFALIVYVLGVRIVASTRQQTRQATTIAAERLTIIRESLMLMRLVKSYSMEQFNQSRIERQLARYGQAQRFRHWAEALAQPALVVLGGVCVLILLYVGALGVLAGLLSTAGSVVLATTLLALFRPIQRWIDARRLLKRGRDASEQVFAFLERKGEVGQVVGAEFLPPLAKLIEFDNVTLRDGSNGRMLLDGVTIGIPAGQRIGLAGADNLEKYALVYLISRLLDPTSGEVRIDDHNLRWVTLDSLRAQVALVMQQNLVFHDTVRNNIGCGDQEANLPQIIEAAKLAHAHHFIQKLPEGYETPIGELGHTLTLSEQYRIALARAILRDPALIVIEEPDSDLDEESKDLIDDTLARILPGRTAIFLPHRISTLKACNKIHLISKGKVVASGSHKELLGTNKLYRHLHYLEFNQMDEMV